MFGRGVEDDFVDIAMEGFVGEMGEFGDGGVVVEFSSRPFFPQPVVFGVEVREDPGSARVQPEPGVFLGVALDESLGDGSRGAFVVRSVCGVEDNVGFRGFFCDDLAVLETADHDADVWVCGFDYVGFLLTPDQS